MNRAKLRERLRFRAEELRTIASELTALASEIDDVAARIHCPPISFRRSDLVPVEIALERLGLEKQRAAIEAISADMTPNTDLLTNSRHNPNYE